MGKRHRAVEGSLDGGQVGGHRGGPRYGDAGEGFGDQEAIPGAQFPRAVGMKVTGANGSANKLGEVSYARFGDHGGASGTIGRDGAIMAIEVGALQISKAWGSVS